MGPGYETETKTDHWIFINIFSFYFSSKVLNFHEPVNVSDFMTLASGIDEHPGVIALREAELRAEQQWQRLKGALAYAEQHCEGDLLNHVLEVQAESLWILHAIPAEE